MSVLIDEPRAAVRGPGRLARPTRLVAPRARPSPSWSRPCSTTGVDGSSTDTATSSTPVPFVIALCGLAAARRGASGSGWRVLIVLRRRGRTRSASTGRISSSRARRRDPVRPAGTLAVLAIFILSGAAGLIYEIVWSRQLVLVFGNTTQAVSAILTGFFGGMAIGGGRRRPDRRPGPLAPAAVRRSWSASWSWSWSSRPISFRLIHEVYRGIYPVARGVARSSSRSLRLVLAVAGARAGHDPDGRDVPEPDPAPRADRAR